MPKINMTKFCNDVKKAKEGLGLTQRQLEAQTGLGHSAISRLMNGHMKRPTYKTVNTLCAALGLEREDYDPANLSDVEKTHEEAKATLARANAMLDEVREKLDTVNAATAEDTPEAVANDLAEERLAALEEAHARIKELSNDFEAKLANAENEIAELKNALDIKNRALAEKSRKVDDLTVKLRDSDTLVFALLEFVNRLKDGDVER